MCGSTCVCDSGAARGNRLIRVGVMPDRMGYSVARVTTVEHTAAAAEAADLLGTIVFGDCIAAVRIYLGRCAHAARATCSHFDVWAQIA